jgi:hypothetical protein
MASIELPLEFLLSAVSLWACATPQRDVAYTIRAQVRRFDTSGAAP